MPEERGLYPKMRVRRPARLLRAAARAGAAAARAAAERVDRAARAGRPRRATASRSSRSATSSGCSSPRRSCTSPTLLVLDEPFSGLDPVGVDVLSGVLAEHAARGVPVRVLLATSSSSSSACARPWRSSRTAGSWRPAAVEELRERGARARRLVRVELAGAPAADWAAARARRAGRAPAGARRAARARCRRGRRRGARRGAAARAASPTSASSGPRWPSCSARRWRREARSRRSALVARREVVERVRERSFLVSTAITVVIIVLVIGALGGVRRRQGLGRRRDRPGGAGRRADGGAGRRRGTDSPVHVHRIAPGAARAQLEDGTLDAVVGRGSIRTKGKPDAQLVALLQAAHGSATAPPPLRVATLEPVNSPRRRGGRDRVPGRAAALRPAAHLRLLGRRPAWWRRSPRGSSR